jgi:F0F1-type ATP synthase assembly protein I
MVRSAMSQVPPPPDGSRGPASSGSADPWSIVAYLLSGMLLFGGAGWLVDQWLDTTGFVLVGLLAGTALAVYLIYVRLTA